MELETRLLNFGYQNPLDGSRQVLSFSYVSKDRKIVTCGLVGEQEFRDRPRIRTQDIEVQKCGAIVSKSDRIGKWCWTATVNDCERLKSAFAPTLQPPTSLLENVCCLQWKIQIGGLSLGRIARRKLPSQGIVSGKSYLPTKGSRGIQSNIYHLVIHISPPISITQFLASLKGVWKDTP